MLTQPRLADPALLSALFDTHGERRLIQRRASLHRAGDPLRTAFLLVEGWLARVRGGPSGAEAITGIFMPGDVIGLDALIDERWPDDLTALSEVTVVRVSLDQVRAAVARGGPAALEVVRLLAADSGFLREALFAVGTQSSLQRLGTFMLQTFDRLLAVGIVAPGVDRFALPLTQAQLGSVAGLTSVHVNRVLKLLRTKGLLDFHGGVVRMMNVPALRRVAQRRA